MNEDENLLSVLLQVDPAFLLTTDRIEFGDIKRQRLEDFTRSAQHRRLAFMALSGMYHSERICDKAFFQAFSMGFNGGIIPCIVLLCCIYIMTE